MVVYISNNLFFASWDEIDTKIGLGVPSSFFLPRRVILDISLLLMLVLNSCLLVSMKTLVSSSFLLFF